jgi:hypothetical protein
MGLGLGLLQDPAVARSWSHPGSWDVALWQSRCVTGTQVCRGGGAVEAEVGVGVVGYGWGVGRS